MNPWIQSFWIRYKMCQLNLKKCIKYATWLNKIVTPDCIKCETWRSIKYAYGLRSLSSMFIFRVITIRTTLWFNGFGVWCSPSAMKCEQDCYNLSRVLRGYQWMASKSCTGPTGLSPLPSRNGGTLTITHGHTPVSIAWICRLTKVINNCATVW